MQTSTFVWIVVVVVVLLGIGWYIYTPDVAPLGTPQAQTTPTNEIPDNTAGTNEEAAGLGAEVGVGVGDASDQVPQDATVTYTAQGFVPQEVTVKRGGTVTWTNDAAGNMWIASAQHPTHTVYSGTSLQQHCDDATNTSFDQCESGAMYTFTFDKVGTWTYHNHSNSSHFGRVIVVE